ncbi:hypothetical protein FSP39_012089 [Pinctada imbricata]|uniref:WD repeat-containing protein 54 beta-propeller domain-containing protein n=1 Tax=Pinctada imbricata TaxID=66713 RepID=A0AA88XZU7_PINIB|nr:hypothetical protein FSP39_012089 [Pinctada imbricata]
MYRKEKPLTLKSSASSLPNNLSVLVTSDKSSLNYAVVHKAVVNIISSTTDGSTVTNRQIICKEPSATQQTTPMVIQAKWITLPVRTIMVLTSLKGIQMFESDGSAMIYWHALGDVNSTDVLEHANFGRGITGIGESFVVVGTQLGELQVFNIPQKGTNITVKESLIGHKYPICDLASDGDTMISCDEQGTIIIWSLQANQFRQTNTITGSGIPVSSMVLWKDIIATGNGVGQIKLYCAKTGKLTAQANAHARWVMALDIAKDNGMLLSASEDSFVRLWKLKPGSSPEIEHLHTENVTDQQVVGAQFIHQGGRAFCVTGYDSCDLSFFVQT